MDTFPILDNLFVKTQEVTYNIFESTGTGIGYIDLIKRFPYRSSRGNQYILVAYYYNANTVLVELVKNRQAATLTAAWTKTNSIFKATGMQPKSYIMNNKYSNDLKMC